MTYMSRRLATGAVSLLLLVAILGVAPIDAVAQTLVSPIYNWNGFYAGLNGGWGFRQEYGNSSDLYSASGHPGKAGTLESDGVIGGGQVGYNWMGPLLSLPNIVLGAEADFSGGNLRGTSTGVSSGGTSYKVITLDKLATLRGRIGYPINNWLLYATGGPALGFSNTTHTQGNCLPGPCPAVSTPGNPAFGAADINHLALFGYAVGTGVEVGFLSHWTTKVEYMHVQFRSYHYSDLTIGRSELVQNSALDIVRIGVNYKFN